MALGLLARREHSQVELYHKLKQRTEISSETIKQFIQELSTEGLQSDERFAEAYVHFRVERGFGPQRILQELLQRGINETISDAYLSQERLDWQNLIEKVWQKHYRGCKPENRAQWSKQAKFLQYRGFTSEQIGNFMKGVGRLDL